MSIYQVAEECYTSRSSVQRFIKSIGYETFTALKETTAEVYSHQASYHTYADHTDYPDYLMHSVTSMMAGYQCHGGKAASFPACGNHS